MPEPGWPRPVSLAGCPGAGAAAEDQLAAEVAAQLAAEVAAGLVAGAAVGTLR